jgi:sulfur carrier protein
VPETVSVNGEPREAVGRSVAQLVADMGLPPDGRGVAVAIAGEVVPRGTWATRTLDRDEHVEVLVAMQGG